VRSSLEWHRLSDRLGRSVRIAPSLCVRLGLAGSSPLRGLASAHAHTRFASYGVKVDEALGSTFLS
jgi:hypothetical protein